MDLGQQLVPCRKKGGFVDRTNQNKPQRPSPQAPPARKPDASEPGPPEDFLRMREWIRQAQSDAERFLLAESDSGDAEDQRKHSK